MCTYCNVSQVPEGFHRIQRLLQPPPCLVSEDVSVLAKMQSFAAPLCRLGHSSRYPCPWGSAWPLQHLYQSVRKLSCNYFFNTVSCYRGGGLK